MVPRRTVALAAAGTSRAPRPAPPGLGPGAVLPERTGAAPPRLRCRRLRVDRLPRRHPIRHQLPAARRGARPAGGVELHPGGAPRLSPGRAAARTLHRDAQLGCRDLRRFQRGESGRGAGGGAALDGQALFHLRDAAAAGSLDTACSGRRLMAHRVLFVSTEVRPYIKVGGLADVAAGLPAALAALGHEVRVLAPATAGALKTARAEGAPRLATIGLPADVGILELPLAGTLAKVWLLDTPGFRRRSGTPNQDDQGEYYPDDAERFDELARIAAGAGGWTPDLVHCHEWHAGLVPVHLMLQRVPTASVFTIHNLEYQGVF